MKVRRDLPKLRRKQSLIAIANAFDRGCQRAGRLESGVFRLVHYSIQNDHLHLIVEAKDRTSLSRGIQGLAVRVAKGLNRLWERKGKVFADRYHDHILRTPREVKNALRYVLNNSRMAFWLKKRQRPDPYSSGAWFDGWRDYDYDGHLGRAGPIARARTWLLQKGWRRHGLIPLLDVPRG